MCAKPAPSVPETFSRGLTRVTFRRIKSGMERWVEVAPTVKAALAALRTARDGYSDRSTPLASGAARLASGGGVPRHRAPPAGARPRRAGRRLVQREPGRGLRALAAGGVRGRSAGVARCVFGPKSPIFNLTTGHYCPIFRTSIAPTLFAVYAVSRQSAVGRLRRTKAEDTRRSRGMIAAQSFRVMRRT